MINRNIFWIYTIKEIVETDRGQDQPSEATEDVKVAATEGISHAVVIRYKNGLAIIQMQSRSKMVRFKNRQIDWSKITKR